MRLPSPGRSRYDNKAIMARVRGWCLRVRVALLLAVGVALAPLLAVAAALAQLGDAIAYQLAWARGELHDRREAHRIAMARRGHGKAGVGDVAVTHPSAAGLSESDR